MRLPFKEAALVASEVALAAESTRFRVEPDQTFRSASLLSLAQSAQGG